MSAASNTESSFETKIKPASQGLLKEFDAPPGLPPAWAAVKDAQHRALLLQKRAMVWAPAMLMLIVGIALGIAPLPLIAKSAVGALAGAVLGWVLASARIQDRRTDALYRRVSPDKIKIVKE